MNNPVTSQSLNERRSKAVPQGPFNIHTSFTARARGALMYDMDGREYIDFAGGIGVMNVGHCHPKVVAAIQDQAEKYIHPCFYQAFDYMIRLCIIMKYHYFLLEMFPDFNMSRQ